MATPEDAVRAIRHVVQEHGDEGTRLGSPAATEAVHWFGQLLGWAWPTSYVAVLARHDGVVVQDAIVFRFVESIEVFLGHHAAWHHPKGFWPVATDGCGNYFALAVSQHRDCGECPVVFVEMAVSAEQPAYTVADSYAGFICTHLQRQCERVGCSRPAR